MTTLQEALNANGCERLKDLYTVQRAAVESFVAALAQQEADKPFQPDWVNYRQGVADGKAEALAQQGEPVFWWDGDRSSVQDSFDFKQSATYKIPLYTAAPAPQQQESACPECHCHFVGSDVTAPGSTRLLNTAPQAPPEVDGGEFVNGVWRGVAAPQPAQGDRPIDFALAYGDIYKEQKAALKAALQSAQPVVNQQMTTVKESLTHQSAQPVAPLTDDQIKSMWAQYCGYPGGILDFARAVREVK